jgi:alpha-1,2-glucosyltransferase
MKAVLIVASLIYFFVNYLVLNKIDEVVKEPYMDEIFHVPQAQQYCVGNYTEVFYFL